MTSIEPGTYLGHYRIVESLGQGGMGEVYRANSTRLPENEATAIISGKDCIVKTADGVRPAACV